MSQGNGPSRQQRANRTYQLRRRGYTWEQIADTWEADYPAINPRIAFRWAHNLTHQDIAEIWNKYDPGEPTMSKARIVQFENWPVRNASSNGRRPTIANLIMLARIFQVSARRLLSDDEYALYDNAARTEIDSVDSRHLDNNRTFNSGSIAGREPSVSTPRAGASSAPMAGAGSPPEDAECTTNFAITGRAQQKEDFKDDVKLRQILIPQSLGEVNDHSKVTKGDVPAIRKMLSALIASDRQFGGGHAREFATEYLRTVVQSRLHAHIDRSVRYEFFGIATEFALRVASMHLDVGQGWVSRRILATASSMAEESGDLTLAAWVLSRRGEQEIHHNDITRLRRSGGYANTDRRDGDHDSIDRAIAYTSGAAALARNAPPVTKAFILAKHALAMSLSGDSAETLRVLHELRESYERAGSKPEPQWMGAYGWGHLRHEEGRCYRNLGMGEEAVSAAEDSMQIENRERFARPRAFTLGIQAIGYAQMREIDRACVIGHELSAVVGHLASDRARLRLAELLDVLGSHQHLTPVTELSEMARPIVKDLVP